jgi:uncharacterized protein (TIGR02597 family)
MSKVLPLLAGYSALLLCGEVKAQSASYSPPAGYFQLSIEGESDNHLAIPLQRPAATYFRVGGAEATSLTSRSILWPRGVFSSVSAGTTQRVVYHAEFCSGPLKGVRYRVLDNSEDKLFLDTRGDDLTAHSRGAVGFDDLVRLRESWEVATVFGVSDEDVAIEPRPDATVPGDSVLLPDKENIGLNKPTIDDLFYVSGAGWRSAGNSDYDEQHRPLEPGEAFIVRRRAEADTKITVLGQVPLGAQSIRVGVAGGDETSSNDSHVSLLSPEPVRLKDAGLSNSTDPASSVIRGSRNRLLRTDELLAFGSGKGFDLAPERSFFHLLNGGWCEAGNANATIGDDFMLQPGTAYIIRRKSGHQDVEWIQPSPAED